MLGVDHWGQIYRIKEAWYSNLKYIKLEDKASEGETPHLRGTRDEILRYENRMHAKSQNARKGYDHGGSSPISLHSAFV